MERHLLESARAKFERLSGPEPLRMLVACRPADDGLDLPGVYLEFEGGPMEAVAYAGDAVASVHAPRETPSIGSFRRAAIGAFHLCHQGLRRKGVAIPEGLHGITGWCVALANWGANSKHPPGSCALARSGGSGVFTYDAAEGILVDVRSAFRDNYDFGPARYAVLNDVVESSIDILDMLLVATKPKGTNNTSGPGKGNELLGKLEAMFKSAEGQKRLAECQTESAVAKLLGDDRRRLHDLPGWKDSMLPNPRGGMISRKLLWQEMRDRANESGKARRRRSRAFDPNSVDRISGGFGEASEGVEPDD